MHVDCLIAFGSNQGESEYFLDGVRERLECDRSIKNVVVSQAIRTPAVGGPGGQNEYLNACIRLQCDVGAQQLLCILNRIENDLGRERKVRWASRTVDLDLLLFGKQVINGQGDGLVVPHPRMSFRRFVLEPAVLIAAEMIHPNSGLSIQQLLRHLEKSDNRIGFVSTTDKRCLGMIEPLRQICDQKCIHFHHFIRPLVPNRTLLEMKLVVYWDRDHEKLREMANSFPGPTLRLESHDHRCIVNELLASIEAMETF